MGEGLGYISDKTLTVYIIIIKVTAVDLTGLLQYGLQKEVADILR